MLRCHVRQTIVAKRKLRGLFPGTCSSLSASLLRIGRLSCPSCTPAAKGSAASPRRETARHCSPVCPELAEDGTGACPIAFPIVGDRARDRLEGRRPWMYFAILSWSRPWFRSPPAQPCWSRRDRAGGRLCLRPSGAWCRGREHSPGCSAIASSRPAASAPTDSRRPAFSARSSAVADCRDARASGRNSRAPRPSSGRARRTAR